MIYLDYAAATPVDEKVLNEFNECINNDYANPNSNHILGIRANKLIHESTELIAGLLKVNPNEIIYTSGATESNNLAIKGIAKRYKGRGKHILVSALEHNSIMAPLTKLTEEGFEVEVIPVLKSGLIDVDALKNMIRDDTILVSVCTVDSELGIEQPIKQISEILSKYKNIIFHTDASQAVGKIKVDFNMADLITFAPHKFYGFNGIGVLIKHQGIELVPLIDGGKSTTLYRAGTPDLANIVALKVALEEAIKNQEARLFYVNNVYNYLINNIKEIDNIKINSTDKSTPYMLNISIDNKSSESVVEELGKKDIIVSSKTSCCPVNTPSKLVYALTHDKSRALTSIRISISHLTTKEEIDRLISALKGVTK